MAVLCLDFDLRRRGQSPRAVKRPASRLRPRPSAPPLNIRELFLTIWLVTIWLNSNSTTGDVQHFSLRCSCSRVYLPCSGLSSSVSPWFDSVRSIVRRHIGNLSSQCLRRAPPPFLLLA